MDENRSLESNDQQEKVIADDAPLFFEYVCEHITLLFTLMKSYPKIGIRPTIDGRLGGVRESLETQPMDMAKSAAALISSSLRHRDGSPVECVIADSCIGGVAEAAACAEKFRNEGVGVSLTVTPSFGDLTEPNAPELFISPLSSLAIHKKEFQHLTFTVVMFVTPAIPRSPLT